LNSININGQPMTIGWGAGAGFSSRRGGLDDSLILFAVVLAGAVELVLSSAAGGAAGLLVQAK
jgi:hypothetical protein